MSTKVENANASASQRDANERIKKLIRERQSEANVAEFFLAVKHGDTKLVTELVEKDKALLTKETSTEPGTNLSLTVPHNAMELAILDRNTNMLLTLIGLGFQISQREIKAADNIRHQKIAELLEQMQSIQQLLRSKNPLPTDYW